MRHKVKTEASIWGCIQNKKGVQSFSEVDVTEVTQLHVC